MLVQGTWHPAASQAGERVLLTFIIIKIETNCCVLHQFVLGLAKDWKLGDEFADNCPVKF